jgi:hypothetical protein
MNQNLHSQKMQGFLFDFFNNGFKMEKTRLKTAFTRKKMENCIYEKKDPTINSIEDFSETALN